MLLITDASLPHMGKMIPSLYTIDAADRGCVPLPQVEDDPIAIHHICCRSQMRPSPTGGRRSHRYTPHMLPIADASLPHRGKTIPSLHSIYDVDRRMHPSPTGGRRSHRYTPYMVLIVNVPPPPSPQGEDDPIATCHILSIADVSLPHRGKTIPSLHFMYSADRGCVPPLPHRRKTNPSLHSMYSADR
jgi:hypothetical protein